MGDIAACLGLFAISFVAATIFPLQSEAALVGLIALGTMPATVLVAVASAGNIRGSAMLGHAQRWYGRYGRWSLRGCPVSCCCAGGPKV